MRFWMLWMVLLALVMGAPRALATSYAFPSSATSNIVIWDGKVLFVQPDGVPVMLGIETGVVVHVGEAVYFGQCFVAIAAGKPVIVNRPERGFSGIIQCVDFATGKRLWQTTGQGIQGVDGEHVLIWLDEPDETDDNSSMMFGHTVRVDVATGVNEGEVDLPPAPMAPPDSLRISPDGITAREFVTSDGEPAYFLYVDSERDGETYGYVDAGARWIGHCRGSDTFSYYGLSHMTSDSSYVVTMSIEGRVECLDRPTGASKWLYMSPPPRAYFLIRDDWTQWRIDTVIERDTRRSATVALPLGDQDDWRIVADKLADMDPPDVPFIRSPTWRVPVTSGWTVALKAGLALLLLAGIIWCVRDPIVKAKNLPQWSLMYAWAFAIAFVLRLTCGTLAPGATVIAIGLQGVLAVFALVCFTRGVRIWGRSKDVQRAAVALVPVLIILAMQVHEFHWRIARGSIWW